jgi:hypothetical protein
MAVYNEILVGRFNRALQKMFGMKGGPPAPQLASEVAMTLSMFYGCENRYLEAWDRFGTNLSVAGVAGQQTGIRFRNPAGSNVIAVIEKMNFAASVAQLLSLGIQVGLGDLASTLGLGSRRFDPRGRINPALIGSSDASAAVVALNASIAFLQGSVGVLTEVIFEENQELPLLPGDSYQITTTVANSNLNGTIWWRERALEPSEVT